MDEIIVHVDIKDVERLSWLPGFVDCCHYERSFKIDPCEWGSMWYGKTRIRFLADIETDVKKIYKIKPYS